MLLLPARLTADEARDVLRMLAQALRQEPDTVVIDAAPLGHFDSAALAVLLECRRLAQGWGKGCTVLHAPAKLAALARLYGIEGLLLAVEAAPAA